MLAGLNVSYTGNNLMILAAHCFYNNVLKEMRNASNYIVAVAKETRNYEKKDNDYQRVYEVK